MKDLRVLLAVIGLIVFSGSGRAADPPVAGQMAFDIPAQRLGDALNAFGRQAGVSIAFYDDAVEGRTAQALTGSFTVEAALARLLADTPLEYEFVNERTVTIRGKEKGPAVKPAAEMIVPVDLRSAQADMPPGATSAASASADGVISGHVVAGDSDSALPGALVRVLESGQTTQTDSHGNFRVPGLATGEYTLSISYLGFSEKLWRVKVDGGEAPAVLYPLEASAWDVAEVTIFGTRSARGKALNQQRTAENSSFVISADTLGNFSGTTISESLRRAPGVAFQRDPYTGDGTNVILRGLAPNFNAVKLNGLNLPTGIIQGSGVSRAPDLSGILSDSVEKITINHSLLPNMDSSGSGGLVEIETKSPLQRPHRYASVGVETGRTGDRTFQDDLLATATVSGTFGEARNFGLSASMQYRDRQQQTIGYGTQLIFGQYLPLGPDGTPSIYSRSEIDPRIPFPFEEGADRAYPNMISNFLRATDSSTSTLTLGGEWLVTDDTNVRLDVTRAESKQDLFGRQGRFDAEVEYVERPIAALDGERRRGLAFLGGAGTSSYYNMSDSDNLSDTYSLRMNSNRGKWRHSAKLGYAAGTFDIPNSFSLGFLVPFDGELPDLTSPEYLLAQAIDPVEKRVLSPFGERHGNGAQLPLFTQAGFDFFNDIDNQELSIVNISHVNGSNDRSTGELTTRYDFDGTHLKYLEVGANLEVAEFSYLDSNSSIDTGRVICDPPGSDNCFLEAYTLADLGVRFEDVDLSAIGIPRGRGFQVLGRDRLEGLMRGILAGDPDFPLLPQSDDPGRRRTSTKENNLAAFVQGRVDFGRLEIVGGARMARVEVSAHNLLSPTLENEDFIIDPAFAERHARLVDDSGTVTDVLPRFQLNYRQTRNLVFRGSYSLAVARPPVRQLSTEKAIAISLVRRSGPTFDRQSITITEGNPELKPAVTHSIDLGVEYYNDEIGLMRLNGFYKHIEHFLEDEFTENAPFDSIAELGLPQDILDDPALDGLDDDPVLSINRPVNNPKPARIWGIEGHLERQFTFLPGFWAGFGVFANLTYTDSNKLYNLSWFNYQTFALEKFQVSAPFEQSPRFSGTFAVTYNMHDIDATLTYSSQDRRQSFFINGSNGLNDYQETYDSLDLRAERRFALWGSDSRAYFEVQDILKSNSDPDLLNSIGGDRIPTYYTNGTYLGGRIFRLGVNVSF